MSWKYDNTIERARIIQGLVKQYYEPGRQDRCKLWVFRNIIKKMYPMSERTFFRYLSIDTEEEKNDQNCKF